MLRPGMVLSIYCLLFSFYRNAIIILHTLKYMRMSTNYKVSTSINVESELMTGICFECLIIE